MQTKGSPDFDQLYLLVESQKGFFTASQAKEQIFHSPTQSPLEVKVRVIRRLQHRASQVQIIVLERWLKLRQRLAVYTRHTYIDGIKLEAWDTSNIELRWKLEQREYHYARSKVDGKMSFGLSTPATARTSFATLSAFIA